MPLIIQYPRRVNTRIHSSARGSEHLRTVIVTDANRTGGECNYCAFGQLQLHGRSDTWPGDQPCRRVTRTKVLGGTRRDLHPIREHLSCEEAAATRDNILLYIRYTIII